MSRTAPAKTRREMVEARKNDPAFNAAYDESETEYALLRERLQARQRAGLAQAHAARNVPVRQPSHADRGHAERVRPSRRVQARGATRSR